MQLQINTAALSLRMSTFQLTGVSKVLDKIRQLFFSLHKYMNSWKFLDLEKPVEVSFTLVLMMFCLLIPS